MPVMNGLEATRAIRQLEGSENLKRIPIIGLSANAMSEHEREGLDSGMDLYLTKPIKKKLLLQALADYTSDASQTQMRETASV